MVCKENDPYVYQFKIINRGRTNNNNNNNERRITTAAGMWSNQDQFKTY